MLAHWNNSPRIDMSPHLDTLSWFRARSGLESTIYHTRGEHANHYATDAVKQMSTLSILSSFSCVNLTCRLYPHSQCILIMYIIIVCTQALVSFKKYMPPPLPYFKVNICPFPLPHFASILFAYLWSFRWPNYIVTLPRYFSLRLPHLNIPSDELDKNISERSLFYF